jgi:glycosyltransferase involved in cell wall biosynthesis
MSGILFNDLIALRQKSGIGHYAAQLLEQFPQVAPDLSVTRLSTLPSARWVAKGMAKGASLGGGAGRLGALKGLLKGVAQGALDRYLGAAVGRGGWDLVHEPDAIAFPTSAKTLVSVMDLSVLLFPQFHPAHRVKKYEKYFMRSLAQAAHFIAISEATKRDLVEHLKVKSDQISAIALAPRVEFRPQTAAVVAAAKKKYALPDRYFLFVGNWEPRKNIPGLLRAYSRLSGTLRASCPLVLVGGWGWKSEESREMLKHSPWKETVKVLGYLPDSDLVPVTQGAMALVYPSFYEGFGLPPLEAMACGTPVICSSAGGLAEAVGSAARLVDPNDEVALSDAMKELAQSEEIRKNLSALGLAQAARFSWEETASETASVYRMLLGRKNNG